MYYLNKIVLGIMNPATFGVVVFVTALMFVFVGLRHVKHKGFEKAKKVFILSRHLFVFCLVWFYFWSTGLSQCIMGKICGFDEYKLVDVEEVPQGDVIVDLGGGVGLNTNVCKYPSLSPAAARPWHAARLWKAGKAPVVITSGVNTRHTDGEFLRDLGVPESALLYDEKSRNTEENAIFVQKLINDKLVLTNVRVLLVTSASHMKRAMMIFRKCAPELNCVPVVADYSSANWFSPLSFKLFRPSVSTFSGSLVVWKECLGVLGYKIRGF